MTAEAEAAEVLAAHRWVDARGDNDEPVLGKYFGCTCGWTHRIDGMTGYWSWRAAHDLHVVAALAAAAGGREAEAWDEGYDARGRDIANEGLTETTLTPNPYRAGGSDD